MAESAYSISSLGDIVLKAAAFSVAWKAIRTNGMIKMRFMGIGLFEYNIAVAGFIKFGTFSGDKKVFKWFGDYF
jgi:hypothetical protein